MPTTPPHNFPTLRRYGIQHHRKSVVVLGAGMSFGLVPGPGPLLREKRDIAEKRLGLHSPLPHLATPPTNHLYEWAQQAYDHLTGRGDPVAKLTLANSLDIPRDDRWRGSVGSRRNTPRHRVIARFAREGLWEQIWSLNWDCVQESALENVGIRRDAPDAMLPWPNVFRTFVTAAECAKMGEADSVKIVKPHGCVVALVQAQLAFDRGEQRDAAVYAERFLITASELARLSPELMANPAQDFIFSTLCTKLLSHPFVVACWSVSEAYLLDYMHRHVRPALEASAPRPQDELSVIDISFNKQGHTRLAGFYGKDEAAAHVPVDASTFTTDELFLWLQALYGLGSLSMNALKDDQAVLASIGAFIDKPPATKHFIVDWVDNFLPAWVRLCWRCGLVRCLDRVQQPVALDDLDLESRDEHIPWSLPGIDRPELTAAARLLARLQTLGNASEWDFETFPGGCYKSGSLIVPLPAWNTKPLNDLRGMKALIDAIKESAAGSIERVKILPLDFHIDRTIPRDHVTVLKELMARNLALGRFARGADIGEITLQDL